MTRNEQMITQTLKSLSDAPPDIFGWDEFQAEKNEARPAKAQLVAKMPAAGYDPPLPIPRYQ